MAAAAAATAAAAPGPRGGDGEEPPGGLPPTVRAPVKGLRWCVMVTCADSVTSKMADAMRCRWWRAIIST